jgi:hypothetical protein
VHVERWPGGVPSNLGTQLLEEARVAGRDRDRPDACLAGEGRRDRVQDEDRTFDAGLAEGERLVERGDAEAVRARPFESAGDRDRPMPVRVRLDDRMDRRVRAGELAEDGDVAGEGVEVDLRPRRARERRQAGGREPVLDRPSRR